MGGMIGVIADHAARYSWFTQCLASMSKPEGTQIEWRMGANRGALRNALVEACLDGECEWLFFVDDDQAFPSGTLRRLLSHGQPVVSALIVQRAAPFHPTAYANRNPDDGFFNTLDLRSVGHNALVQVSATGTGGLLIRAEVLEKIEPPWFVYSEDWGEDLYFANKLEEAGIPMLVDTGCRMGHIAPAAVFPFWDGEQWVLQFTYADGTFIGMAMDFTEKGDE